MLAALFSFVATGSAAAGEINWEGGITSIYQDSNDNRAEAELTASADIFATLPRKGGEWLLYVEASSSPNSNGVSAYYPTVNGDARSVLTSDDAGGVQISEFNYTFLMNNNRTVMLGLIDPSAWLDRGRIANDENRHFLNGSFVNNATIEFPDYTLGGVIHLLGNAGRPEMTFVVSGSDGIADVPDRSYQDLLDLNATGRGVFLGAGTSWLSESFSYRVGAWLRNDDHPVAGDDSENEMNYGAYGVFGWQSGANAISVRAGVANPQVSIAHQFFAIAYQRKTPLGHLGIGVAHTNISPGYRGPDSDVALDSEIYLRIPILNDSGHISPSIQYVEAPGFAAPEQVRGSSAIVPGLRFHWSF